MKKFILVALVLCWPLSAMAVTISGSVFSFNEVTGIPQATVQCSTGGVAVGQGVTNSTGQYSLQVPVGTTCALSATKVTQGVVSYFVDSPRDIVSIQSNRSGENFIQGWQVSGSAWKEDYSGKIADVDILCDAAGSLRDYRTKTLASGQYFLTMKAGTSCALSASKSGYEFYSLLYGTPTIPVTGIGTNWPYVDFVGHAVAQVVDNAVPVSVSVPSPMEVNDHYQVSITMRNSGTTTWTAAAGYKLQPIPQPGWTLSSIAVTGSVAPGSSHTFMATVTAPAACGNYVFQWRMARGSMVLGEASSTNIKVNP